MRAQFVYENLEFRKGKNPISSMGLGILNPEIRKSLEHMFLLDNSGRHREYDSEGESINYPKISDVHYHGWGVLGGKVIIKGNKIGFESPPWNTGPTQSVISSLIKGAELNKYIKLKPVEYEYNEKDKDYYYVFTIRDPYLDLFKEGQYNISDKVE